ncbi:MAG: DUF1206 domain-containing protein [Lysobacter sp.]|nr:DUF1206 domain-containing protein [Lysobacter sp.]MDQ3269450.1 DUF1206 domain-containing protein [Pseudomonadota bacterium]
MNRSIDGAGNDAAHEVAGWVPPIARVGYAAKGVVFALIGWIAIKAAMAAGDTGGATDALASLAGASGGKLMLMAIAAGLLAHVVWRLVQALLDPEHDDTDAKRVAVRLFYALSAVIYGSLAWTAWQLSRGERGGAENGQEIWVARLLEQPFGQWLVMLAGLGVIAYGVHQLVKAAKGDVSRRMRSGNTVDPHWVILIGRIGVAARGFVFLPVGWFVFRAGQEYRAEEAADLDEVLQMLGHGWLLAAVGVGFIAYGLHQVAKAAYRRIERPS